MIDLVFAHPYPQRSFANSALLAAVSDLPDLEVRSLYDRYPDFAIDVEAEQRALTEAEIVVWLHPIYWYSVPPLLKLWFDKVLAYGWAYGSAHALRGKICQWAATTGGSDDAFHAGAVHGFDFEAFVPPIEQTARFCGMRWEQPFVVHGARRLDKRELDTHAQQFRERLQALAAHARGRSHG